MSKAKYFTCGTRTEAAGRCTQALSWNEAKSSPYTKPRSCEEQETSPAQFCQVHLTTSQSDCHKGLNPPFLNSYLIYFFFLFTVLFITIVLPGPHAHFGLAHTKAEVSAGKRSPSAAGGGSSMTRGSRARSSDRVSHLQQQLWLQGLTWVP